MLPNICPFIASRNLRRHNSLNERDANECFIAAEAAECIGCHACEIACAVAHNQENWPLSHSDFRPRIHVLGKGQAANPVACHHCNNAPCVTACPVNSRLSSPIAYNWTSKNVLAVKDAQSLAPLASLRWSIRLRRNATFVTSAVPARKPVSKSAQHRRYD